MDEITEYFAATGRTAAELNALVATKIAAGFQPLGGIAFCYHDGGKSGEGGPLFSQALVKYAAA